MKKVKWYERYRIYNELDNELSFVKHEMQELVDECENREEIEEHELSFIFFERKIRKLEKKRIKALCYIFTLTVVEPV